MAESSESAPKAMDLYLGVVDLFGTILPGALLTYIAARLWGSGLGIPGDWPKETSGWVEFVVISYIAGHVVHAFGSMILDPIYDYTYKLWNTRKYVRIRVRALDVARATLGPFWMEGDNILEWSTTFLRMRSGALSAAIDRLEADSKFFRSLAVVLIVAWPMYVFSLGRSWFYLCGAAIVLVPVLAFAVAMPRLGPQPRHLEECKREILSSERGAQHRSAAGLSTPVPFAAESMAELTANTKLSRRWLRWVIIVAFVWAFLISLWACCVPLVVTPKQSGPETFRFLAGVCGFVLLTLFAAWRFMELRLKRTEVTYHCVIALFAVQPLFKVPEAEKEAEGSTG